MAKMTSEKYAQPLSGVIKIPSNNEVALAQNEPFTKEDLPASEDASSLRLAFTAIFEIIVNAEQSRELEVTIQAYWKACDYVSDFIVEQQNCGLIFVHNNLFYKIREIFKLKSNMAQSVIKTVVARYEELFAGNETKAQLAKEQNNELICQNSESRVLTKLDFNHSYLILKKGRNFRISREIASISTLNDTLKLPLFTKGLKQFFEDRIYKLGSARLVKLNGKFYLHIEAKKRVSKSRVDELCYIFGIDNKLNIVFVVFEQEQLTSSLCLRMEKE